MEIEYASEEVKEQCTSVKAAKKLFGGNVDFVKKLFSVIQALESSETIKDIIMQPTFRFHKLKNKNGKNLEGFFAIDLKTPKEPWRIILRPLDDEKQPYVPCDIDKIADVVQIVEIKEISKHYE